jgi:hypothetical protein
MPFAHFFWRGGLRVDLGSTTWRTVFRNTVGNVYLHTTNGATLKAADSSLGTLEDSGWSPDFDRWYLCEIEIRMDGINGIFRVWIDNVLMIDYAGDVGSQGDELLNEIELYGETNAYWDDLGLNSVTMTYDGGSSFAPVVGDTLDGDTSGASAIISAIDGDGVSGRLWLEGWDGTPFQNDEPLSLTGTGTGTAVVNAPWEDTPGDYNGFEPNSGRLGNGIVRYFPVDGVGNSEGMRMLGTTGATASETLTTTGQAVNNETVTIDASSANGENRVYTWKDTLTGAADEVKVGATQALSMENLRRAIMGDGIEGTNYGVGTAVNRDVTATDTATTVVVTSVFNGDLQNSIAVSETMTNGSWGAATLSGGSGENYEAVDGVTPTVTDYVEATNADEQDTYTVDTSYIDGGSDINAVATQMITRSSLGVIDGQKHIMRPTSTDNLTAREDMGSSWSQSLYTWEVNPDDDSVWELNDLQKTTFEVGVQLVD